MDKEFNIIKKFFSPIARNKESLNLSNDAAFIKNKNLVISSDMMIEDQHFTNDYDPKIIAKKLLRVNLSDIAAMGATPYGFILNMAIPKKNIAEWLKNFVLGLKSDMKKFNLKLFGGDLSCSQKIFLSVTMLGKTKNFCHSQNMANLNSEIFMTGTLGDAALGFKLKRNSSSLLCSQKNKKLLLKKFYLPEPRLEIAKKLLNKSEFCTDISDGLVREIMQIAIKSKIQANIYLDKIPLSVASKEILKKNKNFNFWETVLNGGEDYELLFSLQKNKKITEKSKKITKIGFFSKGYGLKILNEEGKELKVNNSSFSHF